MKRGFFIYILVLVSLLQLSACGTQDDEQKREAAIEKAFIYMSGGNCRDAISVLEAAPSSDTDARYLKTLSIAYACRAGYSTVRLFAQDLEQFSGAGSFLNALARFSTSSLMTEVDSANFEDMQRAIDILLYAGGIDSTKQPTATRRANYFNAEDAGEINAQLSYLLMAQLGMYFRYFGNTDATGIKSSGTGTNDCLLTYSTANAQAIISAPSNLGSCDNPVADTGHPELLSGGNAKASLACYGVTLFNNLTDVLPAVVAAASSGLLDGAWINDIDDAKDAILLAYPGFTLVTEQNYSQCVTDNTADDANLELYFAGIFEGALL